MLFKNQDQFITLKSSFLASIMGRNRIRTVRFRQEDLALFESFLFEKSKRKVVFDLKLAKSFHHHLEKKKYLISTQYRKANSVKLFFDYLVTIKETERNIFTLLGNTVPMRNLPQYNTMEDIIESYDFYKDLAQKEKKNRVLKASYLQNSVIIALLYTTGIGTGEMTELTKNNFVINSYDPQLYISGKTKGLRTIPLNKSFVTLYKKYTNLLKEIELPSPHLFFCTPAGHFNVAKPKITPRIINKFFNRWETQTGIKLYPKLLRNSCVLRWISQGIEEKYINEWIDVREDYDLSKYQILLESDLEFKFHEDFY